jgi:hypothetical protein
VTDARPRLEKVGDDEAVGRELKRDPSQANNAISKLTGVPRMRVARMRKELGQPSSREAAKAAA